MSRIQKIVDQLPKYNIDAMLVTSQPGELYAFGCNGESYGIISPKGARYITDSRYTEVAEETIKDAEVITVDGGRNYAAAIQEFLDANNIKTLGIEDGYMSLGQYNYLKDNLKGVELVYANSLIVTLRGSKDEDELAIMMEAQRITDEAFAAICKYIKPGMTEAQIAAQLTFEQMARGAQRMSFPAIVASGPNGSRPHAIPSLRQVQKGDFITMDFGCVYKGYCSDMTRTVAIGSVSAEQEKVYYTVLKAQKAGIAASRAGVLGKDIHNAAAKVIADAGYGEFFGHGYGHSLGIEVHEAPNANTRGETPMPVGAMVSAEPGIYLPGRFGVRIEDCIRMLEGGTLDITHSPKEEIILL